MGRLRQFNRMKAVFHAMHSGIEQSVSGLSGRAAIGVTICWMSGIGRGSRIDSRSRVTQISLKRPIGSQCADRRLLRIPGTGVHGSWQTGHPHPEAQRYHQTRSPLDISAGG